MHNRLFPEKVIKYLWDDAFKFNPEALFDTVNMESLEQVIRTFVHSRGVMDEKSSEKQYFFGTDFFERIWEKMIDKAFGIEDKDQYFPRTRWLLDYGPNKTKTPLQPDTIMIYNGKVYVLNAKLYRYGYSNNPNHLPNGPDINIPHVQLHRYAGSAEAATCGSHRKGWDPGLLFRDLRHKDEGFTF